MTTINIFNPGTAFQDASESANHSWDMGIKCPECEDNAVIILKCGMNTSDEGAHLQLLCTSCRNQFGITVDSHAGYTGLVTRFITKDRYIKIE